MFYPKEGISQWVLTQEINYPTNPNQKNDFRLNEDDNDVFQLQSLGLPCRAAISSHAGEKIVSSSLFPEATVKIFMENEKRSYVVPPCYPNPSLVQAAPNVLDKQCQEVAFFFFFFYVDYFNTMSHVSKSQSQFMKLGRALMKAIFSFNMDLRKFFWVCSS